MDSQMFNLNTTPGKESAVLAIPESCVNRIITLYHCSIFGGHQGVIKTYLTIHENFFISNLIHYLGAYIKGCHIHQLHRNVKPKPIQQLQQRINCKYIAIMRISMDLKVMPQS